MDSTEKNDGSLRISPSQRSYRRLPLHSYHLCSRVEFSQVLKAGNRNLRTTIRTNGSILNRTLKKKEKKRKSNKRRRGKHPPSLSLPLLLLSLWMT